ncbi:MAG: AAA family ATPase, partial [Planctomycetes bacterium]|nr:AAA family ATPase [Planctomycetota bacterium]
MTTFGRHRDLQLDFPPTAVPIVIVGANEAGKSTLFEFVVTMLFGFEPADRSSHPYRPWVDGGVLGGSLDLELGDGEVSVVTRELADRPRGERRYASGHRLTFVNEPIVELQGVSRPLYRDLGALADDDLRRLDFSSWRRIEDRLLSGAAGALRPASEVIR